MKIMIVYAYAGIGHKKAADAISEALSGNDTVELSNIDVLDYTNAIFKFLYPRIYLFLINKTPLLWGFFYYIFDIRFIDSFLAPVRRFFHNTYAKRFIELVAERKPDVVVCTHFLPAEVVSDLKKRGIFKGKLVTVITDFMPHSFWMAHDSDYFIAAIDSTKKDLLRRGVEEERIKIFGIPCETKFSETTLRKGLMKKLGIKDGFFNLLIMGGGFGSGPVKDIVFSIANMESRIRDSLQLIVVCGKNKALFEELTILKRDLNIKLAIFGFMNNIDEFMEVSNCIITKSGGLTVSEALSKTLPMIIIQPIPGQETKNCKILSDYGAAVCARTTKEVLAHVKDLMACPEKITDMKARINLLSYPDAAEKLADFIITDKRIQGLSNEN